MPITPLHVGILAPINHWFPNKVSNISFILVTLLLDGASILYYGFGIESIELHGPITHSFEGGAVIATIIGVFGIWSMKWLLGAYLGMTTHIFVDALVHAEMLPLYPYEGNPFFWGNMDIVSLLMLPMLVWWVLQCVSYACSRIRQNLQAAGS